MIDKFERCIHEENTFKILVDSFLIKIDSDTIELRSEIIEVKIDKNYFYWLNKNGWLRIPTSYLYGDRLLLARTIANDSLDSVTGGHFSIETCQKLVETFIYIVENYKLDKNE